MNIITKFPIGQYIDGNKSWLRIIDSRLKLILVTLFLITPIWAGPIWRLSLVLCLIFITLTSALSYKVWWRTLFFLILLSTLVGFLSILAASNISLLEHSIRDPNELIINLNNKENWNLIEIPVKNIWFLKFGPFNLSKRACLLGIKTSTLIFTVVHSVNLMLLTTLKEEIIWAIGWFLNPLRGFGWPVDKLLFQLFLSLRFIPLVQEEFQNLVKSVSVRSINYRYLGLKNSIKILFNLIERLFLNIFLRIEQGSDSLLSKRLIEIKIKRFKPLDNKNGVVLIANMLSIIFIFLAIFLRKQYGSI